MSIDPVRIQIIDLTAEINGNDVLYGCRFKQAPLTLVRGSYYEFWHDLGNDVKVDVRFETSEITPQGFSIPSTSPTTSGVKASVAANPKDENGEPLALEPVTVAYTLTRVSANGSTIETTWKTVKPFSVPRSGDPSRPDVEIQDP